MIGTFLVPIGLFYQAWTSFPSLPPWPCLSAGILFGAGILTCFISSYQYIIDVYQVSRRLRKLSFDDPLSHLFLSLLVQAGSATALGSLTFVRYIVSGGAVMFTRELERNAFLNPTAMHLIFLLWYHPSFLQPPCMPNLEISGL